MAVLMRRLVGFDKVLKPKVFSYISSATLKTTGKNKETIVTKDILPQPPRTVEDFADVKKQKNWVSFGFDFHSPEEDRLHLHVIFFMTVTVCLVGGTFIMMYLPDFKTKDWITREAFLELHRREKEGLPLIDRNLIDPAKITLPSEEELEGVEIII